METKIISANELFLAVEEIKRGSCVAFPTETVYGLGALALEEEAIQKIFNAKNRPSDNPLIAHISTLSQAKELAYELTDDFFKLADTFWPGPLTLIVKRGEKVPASLCARHPTVAIRMPSHPIARRLIDEVGAPIAAPSANLSGRPSATTAGAVLEDLGGKIRYIVDGGACELGIESTVLALCGETAILLRPGSIQKQSLETVLQKPIRAPKEGDQTLSPGMRYRHYAPKAKVRLVFDLKELKGSFILPTSQSLYHELREADRKSLEEIVIFCDEEVQKNEALMNRLLRAAGQMV